MFRIKTLSSFDKSAFEADTNLYVLSPKASDRFFGDYKRKIENIKMNPYTYQVFEEDTYFRSAPLLYGYRLFYHIDEKMNQVVLHRIIHGTMDLIEHMQDEIE